MYDLERFNYFNDSRVIERMTAKSWSVLSSSSTEISVQLCSSLLEHLVEEEYLPEAHDGVISCSVQREVCDSCEGSGVMVEPGIDAGGITQEEFLEDPGFYEAYMSGSYNTTCSKCSGLRVLERPQWPEELYEEIETWEQAEIEFAHERANELKWGY